MATEEIPPGSVLNQVPSEQPVDPQHTEGNAISTSSSTISAAKPYKLNSSSPSPATAQVPLQVHVPAALAGGQHAHTRTLPGGLLAQPPYATHLPAAQAGLMPFPYGQQLIAAGGPRQGVLQHIPAGLAGLPGQPMLLPGGGIIRHQRRTMAPVMHPYQRVAPMAAAAQPVQQMHMLTAARAAAIAPQATAIQTPYGQMFIPASTAGLQYRLPTQQAQMPQQALALDPATAALYAQYPQTHHPYMQQLQHPTMAAMAAAAAAGQAYSGAQPQQQYYDPQKFINAHYAQMLVPDQNSVSPPASNAINGTTSEYSETQET